MSRVAGKIKLNIAVLLIIQAILGVSGVLYAVVMRELVNTAVAKQKRFFDSGFHSCGIGCVSNYTRSNQQLLR